MKNINNAIRNYINKSINNLDNYLLNRLYYDNYDIYKLFDTLVLKELKNINIKDTNIIYTFIQLVSYSSTYTVLNYKDKNNKLSTEEKRYLKRIKNIKDYDKLNKAFDNDLNFVGYMLKTSNIFNNLRKFDKVVLIKSLDEEDIQQICNINVLFNGDIEEYNVDIDDYFIINEIKKLKHHYEILNKEDNSYYDTVNFINKLSKIENIDDILINMDISLENLNENVVRNYFESLQSKVIKLSKDDINAIK